MPQTAGSGFSHQVFDSSLTVRKDIIFSTSTTQLSPELGGDSPIWHSVLGLTRKCAECDSTVLLKGPCGSGKTLIARYIHENSSRAGHLFMVVNCGNVTPGLVNSELFGHEKGAFTGADTQKKGKFEVAVSGTVFLDDIQNLPREVQPQLLRFLEEKKIQRVGGHEDLFVDVRIIAASNRDLREMLKTGEFREDLYYRLNIVEIFLPALCERTEDIPLLTNHFLTKLGKKTGRLGVSISPDALALLKQYPWPGNVRELEHEIERCLVLSTGSVISCHDLSIHIRNSPLAHTHGSQRPGVIRSLKQVREEADRQALLDALQYTKGNVKEMAKGLEVDPITVKRMLRKFDPKTG